MTPSTGLVDGQPVEVHVTGFGIGGIVRLSECASAVDANDLGCGEQLAAQPLLVTDDSGSGTASFTVNTSGYTKPYDLNDTAPCTDRCVVVATQGGGYDYADAPISFAP